MRVPSAVSAVLTAVLLIGAAPAAAQVPPPPPAIPRPPGGFQAPPRDPGQRPSEPVGTAAIRGRVVAADTGNPIRRASVTLIPSAVPAPASASSVSTVGGLTTINTQIMNGVPVSSVTGRARTATTDGQGAFEFTGLPAGGYRITASPGQFTAGYLTMAYGAQRPNGPGGGPGGTLIQLTDGQSFEKASIALPRGGVITGRVTDENGDALARVQVYTVGYLAGSARGVRTGSGGSTDDLGQFRLWGLAPGEYTVVAEARGNTFVQPNAPPQSEEDKIGFMTTYYPGTADEGSAGRVRARAGAETNGVEIRMVSGRLFQITGSVVDSQGRPAARANGNLWRRMAGTSGSMSVGFSTDEQGRFQMRNVAPGSYRVSMQPRQAPPNPDGSRGETGELVNMPLTVASDIADLLIITTPGATITGQISFEQGPPQVMPQGLRVNVTPGSPDEMIGIPGPQPAVVTPDLTFTVKGLLGEFLLRASAPNQSLKAVMLGGTDISDTPHEFKGGEKVTMVLTSRASTLEGNVTDAKGQPSTDALLIVFSEDKGSWRTNSLRTRRGGVDPTGHYKITGLLPGRYFVAAGTRERFAFPGAGADAAFFEQLSKEATSLVIGEDDQRQVDLRVLAAPGGQ
ncbi:MAG TPA: carboxypeptidase-like regulatory domain-containing protein [Vicinamibacterales bacterium]|nr:carboxypeptidase-like regulatory domain-containing protein [Vicinamibacterales bacterium]